MNNKNKLRIITGLYILYDIRKQIKKELHL